MSELGPYYPTPGGKLQKNPHAWNQIANIIFLESPAFVGWSYSNTSTDIVVGKHTLPFCVHAAAFVWTMASCTYHHQYNIFARNTQSVQAAC